MSTSPHVQVPSEHASPRSLRTQFELQLPQCSTSLPTTTHVGAPPTKQQVEAAPHVSSQGGPESRPIGGASVPASTGGDASTAGGVASQPAPSTSGSASASASDQ